MGCFDVICDVREWGEQEACFYVISVLHSTRTIRASVGPKEKPACSFTFSVAVIFDSNPRYSFEFSVLARNKNTVFESVPSVLHSVRSHAIVS